MGETIRIDPNVSISRAMAATTNEVGYCLANVASWLGWPPVFGKDASIAVDVWQYAVDKHPGDMNPPVGTVVVLGAAPGPRWPGDHNFLAGDVALVIGPGGLLRATDYPTAGVVGNCTLKQRIAQTGRPYLGWVGDYYGNPISYNRTDAPASTAAAAAGEASAMAYSIVPDAQSATIWIYSLTTGKRAAIATPSHVDILRRVKDNPGTDKMLQAEMDIVASYIRAINPPPAVSASVDKTAVQAAVSAALAAHPAAAPVIDKAALAKAVADELHSRMAA